MRARWSGKVAAGLAVLATMTVPALAAGGPSTWPMSQKDPQHTGRAEAAIPASRQNDSFFDVFLWQKPSPDSPADGNFGATQMVFFDGAGPGLTDIVLGAYHWPKGVQGMDRHTGATFWHGNPAGGESIAQRVPAFSNDGSVIYVHNDATDGPEYPQGHPLMAFRSDAGPSAYWHNGGDADPAALQDGSPVVAPDGRIFMHRWYGAASAGVDDGTAITVAWSADGDSISIHGDVSLWDGDGLLRVVAPSRNGFVRANDGLTGEVLWETATPLAYATPTIDPSNGNVYVAGGEGSVFIIGLDKDGVPLWDETALPVFTHEEGVNDPQIQLSPGCLSHDGATYYFQTVSENGQGRLYAITTADGSVKWSYATESRGWHEYHSSPVVTPDGILIVGNNEGDTYFAIRDDGTQGTLLDTLAVDPAGNARASATLAPGGTLYLPLRTAWVAGNGDGEIPTYLVANLFSALDLRDGAVQELYPPGWQRAFARNHAVLVKWNPIVAGAGSFAHYAIYRSTAPFATTEGMTPIATLADAGTASYTDGTALNGTAYWYAVTTVSTSGHEIRNVPGVGPRTPRDETDLQVVTVDRTPRYPRYAAEYTGYDVTEPSGFGPYTFSAATGLGQGQDATTKRWPDLGEVVTFTATIRNRGTNDWFGELVHVWTVDGDTIDGDSRVLLLHPGETAAFTFPFEWDGELHDIGFRIEPADARAGNDALSVGTKSVAFLSFLDETKIENFREETPGYPSPATDDHIDWVNHNLARFNALFAAAGTAKRVHYGVLEVLDDPAADPPVNAIDFAIFPFRWRANEGSVRLSGYYDASEDIDYGLLHEWAHQLGLIDIYQMDIGPEQNLVSGEGYYATTCLMNSCSHVVSEHSARAMTHWLDTAHGYFGQYLYQLPDVTRMRFTGIDGLPVAGATVSVYQLAERPGLGKLITDQVKAQGVTDENGVFVLPNVPIDPLLVPTTFAGDRLRDNPFGYVAVIGTNGLLHLKIEKDGFADFAWLEIAEVNNAYWAGQTAVATFDRNVRVGGPVLTCVPSDTTELNAADWQTWSDGGTASAFDDTTTRQVGLGSIRAVTTGGFDNYWRFPGNQLAKWDLSNVATIRMWFYHLNDNGFQSGSPWVILRGPAGSIELHPTWDILQEAYGVWRRFDVPIGGDETWIRTDHGAVSLADIRSLEIHADTWDYGFTLWMDGVGFDPAQPGEAARLALHGAAPTTLAWPAVPLAQGYDVSRGTMDGLGPGQYGACLANDLAGTSLDDGDVPPAGEGFFYLVRALAPACGQTGSWGTDSSGNERINGDPLACP